MLLFAVGSGVVLNNQLKWLPNRSKGE